MFQEKLHSVQLLGLQCCHQLHMQISAGVPRHIGSHTFNPVMLLKTSATWIYLDIITLLKIRAFFSISFSLDFLHFRMLTRVRVK